MRPSNEPVLFVGRDTVSAGLFRRQLVEVVGVVMHDPDAAFGVQLEILVVVVLAAGVGRHTMVPTKACRDAPVAPHSQLANAAAGRSAATLAQVHVCCGVEGLAGLLRVAISPPSPKGDHRQKFPCLLSRNRIIAALLLNFCDSGNNWFILVWEEGREEEERIAGAGTYR